MNLSRKFFARSLVCACLCAAVLSAQNRKPQPGPEPSVRRARPAVSLNGELATAINELLKTEPRDYESAAITEYAKTRGKEAPAKLPADDAPLAELLAYWQQPRDVFNDATKPSEKTVQRLLEAIEARPWLLNQLLDKLPENEATAERLYKIYQQTEDEDDRWKGGLQHWLKYDSRYFLDELLASAKQEAAEPGMDPLALEALARLDWDKAKPLLQALPENPFAVVSLYKGAMRNTDLALADQVRTQLRAVVADREAPEMRMIALQALFEGEWSGQADWLAGLFADASLTGARPERSERRAQHRTRQNKTEPMREPDEPADNLLAPLLQSQRKRLLPIVQKLVDDRDRNVHNAAVDTLAQFLFAYRQAGEPEAAEAARTLLPWLSNPAWADGPQREQLIGALPDLKLPESASGALWVLQNDEDESLRALAAETLGKLKFTAAAPAIRRALEREKDEELRERLVTALMLCGGISDEEAAAAIEAYARKLTAPISQAQLEAERKGPRSEDAAPLPLQLSIGRILSDNENIPCPEGLAARLFARVKALRNTQPAVAREILAIVQGAPLPIAYQFLAERLAEGWLDVEALKLALEDAAAVRQHASGTLFPLLTKGGHAAGVAALLLNDTALQNEMLRGKDTKAQLALLASARYLRTSLPVDLVAALLADKTLAAAAESYLIVEDSPVARRLVWARHPGEALILGESKPREFAGLIRTDVLPTREEAAQQAVKAGEAEELYAIYNESSDKPNAEIRWRKGRAQLRLFKDADIWRARELSNSELSELQTLLARPELAELKPEAPLGGYQEGFAEFVRVSKDGGYRVVLEGMKAVSGNVATLHEQLSELFYRFSKAGEFVTHYAIEAKLPGVEVMFADEKQYMFAVCQESDDTLVLVGERFDPTKPIKETPHWYLFKDGQFGSAVNVPKLFAELERFDNNTNYLRLLLSETQRGILPNVPLEVLRQTFDIAKSAGGPRPVLGLGEYLVSFSTPDQQWSVGTELDPKNGARRLMRRSKQTGQQFEVGVGKKENHEPLLPVKYLEGLNKALLVSDHLFDSQQWQFFLLDLPSGALQPAKGEFRPLLDQALRSLQPNAKTQEFWAVLNEGKDSRIGRYDERSFTFTPVLTVPDLQLRNADVWVDEARGKVWLTYKGHLLRLPLPAAGK